MKLSVEISGPKRLVPPLILPDAVLHDIGRVAAGGIIENIDTQKQADGSPIKENKPSTKARKRRRGWTHNGKLKSLVAEKKRLVKGSGQKDPTKGGSYRLVVYKGQKRVLVRPAPGKTKKIVGWVQEKDYTGWFALSRKHISAIKHVIRDWIVKEFRKHE